MLNGGGGGGRQELSSEQPSHQHLALTEKLKLWGGGAENNTMRSSINGQCYFYAKCNKNASTRACFLKFLGEQITHSKSVARCVVTIFIFYNK